MFRLPLLVALGLIVAFGGGIWSTLVALDATTGFGAIKLGPWEAFPQAQTIDADPYAKAHRANAGRLLLGSAEGLSFTAAVDDDGAPLTGNCTYLLTGQTPQARLWTLFVTSGGLAPPQAQAERPVALNSRIVLRKADGSFDITLSAGARPGNWLSLPENRPFRLVLTLLDTPTAGSSGLLDLTMPKLEKIGCGNA
ncbi:DUF1214 domain-containing protein [Rhizobium helianthi]|uniref:DUF1214 domain-containing protein n=1 Tax=Rhizobium helianthi TaxID=1132695 RepID=A0ABW4M567_9HYPH